ncbi:MAG: Ig domain-containing protein [archaeon]
MHWESRSLIVITLILTLFTSNAFAMNLGDIPSPQTLIVGEPYSLNVEKYFPEFPTNFSDNTELFDIDLETGIISFTPNPGDVGTFNVKLVGYSYCDNIEPGAIYIGFKDNIVKTTALKYLSNKNLKIEQDLWLQSKMMLVTVQKGLEKKLIDQVLLDDWAIDWAEYVNIPYFEEPEFFCDNVQSEFQEITFNINSPPENTPPVMDVPDFETDEDVAFPEKFIDLRDYASDLEDSVEDLTFTFLSQSNPGLIYCEIVEEHFIDCGELEEQFYGYSNVRVKVTDTGGLSVEDVFKLTVKSINDLPEILNPINEPITITEGENFYYDYDATDVEDMYDLVFSDDTDLFNINPVTGVISFTAGPEDAGTYNITITVEDTEQGTDTDDFVLNVETAYKDISVDEIIVLAPSILNEAEEVEALITNHGSQTENVTIELYVDNEVFKTYNKNIEAGQTYNFNSLQDWTPTEKKVYDIKVKASIPGEEDENNNEQEMQTTVYEWYEVGVVIANAPREVLVNTPFYVQGAYYNKLDEPIYNIPADLILPPEITMVSGESLQIIPKIEPDSWEIVEWEIRTSNETGEFIIVETMGTNSDDDEIYVGGYEEFIFVSTNAPQQVHQNEGFLMQGAVTTTSDVDIYDVPVELILPQEIILDEDISEKIIPLIPANGWTIVDWDVKSTDALGLFDLIVRAFDLLEDSDIVEVIE